MTTGTPLQLSIDGMHCDACVSRVTTALKTIEGVEVEQVLVGSARVSYDPELVRPEQITSAVDDIGFTASAQPTL